MKAIETRYLGPTNVKGSRIKATAEGGHSLTLSCDDGLNSDENHAMAAGALKRKLGWDGEMVGGGMVKGGMAWVFTSRFSPRID